MISVQALFETVMISTIKNTMGRRLTTTMIMIPVVSSQSYMSFIIFLCSCSFLLYLHARLEGDLFLLPKNSLWQYLLSCCQHCQYVFPCYQNFVLSYAVSRDIKYLCVLGVVVDSYKFFGQINYVLILYFQGQLALGYEGIEIIFFDDNFTSLFLAIIYITATTNQILYCQFSDASLGSLVLVMIGVHIIE